MFFSFLGFENVATAAEETVDPTRSLPVGIIASLLISAVIYAAMCATIVGMVPWQDIDVDTPFSTAYAAVGMPWAGRIVSLGALFGIVTGLLVTLFGQIRLWMALGRAGLLPRACVRVRRTRTHACMQACQPGSAPVCLLALQSTGASRMHGKRRCRAPFVAAGSCRNPAKAALRGSGHSVP